MRPFSLKPQGFLPLLSIAALALLANNAEAFRTPMGVSRPTGEPWDPSRHTTKLPEPIYGWRLFIKSKKATVHWREEFHLPAPAAEWNAPSFCKVSGDKRSCTTQGDTKPGWIANVWSVSKGDPDGEYVFDVYVDDQFMREFKFKLDHLDDHQAHMKAVSGDGAFVLE